MQFQKSKGFTLIELLVVIAIIGILASIVLVTFPSATKKAKDSRIVGAIGQARTVMTYTGNNDGDYDAFDPTLVAPNDACSAISDLIPLCDEVTNNGGALTFAIDGAINSTSACMYSALNTGGYYCADSDGYAGATSTDPGAASYCTGAGGSPAKCPGGLTNP